MWGDVGRCVSGLAGFYEVHGEAMLLAVERLAASHRADLLVVGSCVFCLSFLRSLGPPVAHVRFAPYGTVDREQQLPASGIAALRGETDGAAREQALQEHDAAA